MPREVIVASSAAGKIGLLYRKGRSLLRSPSLTDISRACFGPVKRPRRAGRRIMSYYEIQEDEAIVVVTMIAGPIAPTWRVCLFHYNVRVLMPRRHWSLDPAESPDPF